MFLKVGTAMFGYMTDLDTVDVVRTEEITAEGKLKVALTVNPQTPKSAKIQVSV